MKCFAAYAMLENTFFRRACADVLSTSGLRQQSSYQTTTSSMERNTSEEPPRPGFCACISSFRADKLTGEPFCQFKGKQLGREHGTARGSAIYCRHDAWA